MRWRDGEVRKRHVPEPERLRDQAGSLKWESRPLLREADALLAEAEAFEAAEAGKQKPTVSNDPLPPVVSAGARTSDANLVPLAVSLRTSSKPSQLSIR
jgi:hypothetical protein